MDLSGWIGKPVEEAMQYSKRIGFSARIIQVDGEPMILTCDFNRSRVGLVVQDGIVQSVSFG
jgi:hypothetical protein